MHSNASLAKFTSSVLVYLFRYDQWASLLIRVRLHCRIWFFVRKSRVTANAL